MSFYYSSLGCSYGWCAKGGLSTDALNKTDTSSGTDILGSSNPSQQQGGLLNIFREGRPGKAFLLKFRNTRREMS